MQVIEMSWNSIITSQKNIDKVEKLITKLQKADMLADEEEE